MNYDPLEAARIEAANREYIINAHTRLRVFCCGFVSGNANLFLICILWAALSFYFTILAFMQKSPFYSYVEDVALIAFGAINLLFGIVTLTSLAVFSIHWVVLEREKRIRFRFIRFTEDIEPPRSIVYSLSANAIGVLIVALINFILFTINKNKYHQWCLNTSKSQIVDVYNTVNRTEVLNTTVTIMEEALRTSSTNNYNCQRLYEDEVKWSLLCLITMFIVYIHWVLIISARETYRQYRSIPMASISEFSNIRPSAYKKNRIDALNNVKPSRTFWKELLVHKQYGPFKDGSQEIMAAVDDTKKPTVPNLPDENHIIQFENDLYESKEIPQPHNAVLADKKTSFFFSKQSPSVTS